MHQTQQTFARLAALTLFSLFLSGQVLASQAGWRQITVQGTAPSESAIPLALYYPTPAPARAIAMGPFTVQVAMRGEPDVAFKGLIVLSHGTGGTELGHSSLAEALARHGYLVAALRHPGDNWQDRSLLHASAARYFTERPRQVSRVIDALLRDPEWANRIAKDAKGLRIGAVGHSAGGYTVLALAGAQPDLLRLTTHCDSHRAEDPIFCSMGRAQPQDSSTATPVADARVRAVVALAPLGVVFGAASIAKVRIPVAIYESEQDRFLVRRFHSEWVARNLPGAEYHRVSNAGHFAFMDTPSSPVPSEDGDIAANPPGFDRSVFLEQLGRELPTFFDSSFR